MNDSRYIQSEYFLLENRQQQGADISAPGKGLLITHVDERYSYFDGFQPQLAKIEPADGTFTQGDSTDTFGDGANANQFTATTTPNTNDNNGNATNIAITGITTNGDTININQINFIVRF